MITSTALITATHWRNSIQLAGLQRNQEESLAIQRALLGKEGSLGYSYVGAALHDTENALAVAMSPVGLGGCVGLLPLPNGPSVGSVPMMRWLDLPP